MVRLVRNLIKGGFYIKNKKIIVTISLVLSCFALLIYFSNNNSVPTDHVKIALLDSGLSITNYEEVNIISFGKSTSSHADIMLKAILSKIDSNNQKKVTIIDYPVTSYETNISEKKVLRALQMAIEKDVDIINMSFGFKKNIPELKQLIIEAKKKDIKIIAAAGNTYGFYTNYPAKYSSVVSIGSEEKNKIANYSAVEDVDYFLKGYIKNEKNRGTSISTAYFTGISINNLLNGEKKIHDELKEKRDFK